MIVTPPRSTPRRGLGAGRDAALRAEIDRGLVSVADSGGAEETIATPDFAKGAHLSLAAGPSGRKVVLFTSDRSRARTTTTTRRSTRRPRTGERKRVEGASFARYSPAAG